MKSYILMFVLMGCCSVAAFDSTDFCKYPFRSGKDIIPTVVHIPKTAGTSFATDVKNVYNSENCLMQEEKPGLYMVSFFREPRGHVYSQFAQVSRSSSCPQTTLKPNEPIHIAFGKWVQHFYSGLRSDGSMAETDSLGCYHPYNMQARAMSRLCTAQNNKWPRDRNFGVHFFHDNVQTVHEMETNLDYGLKKLDFVGITQFYEASMCIYQHLAGKPLFKSCRAGQALKNGNRSRSLATTPDEFRRRLQTHDRHGVVPHPHTAVDPQVWAQVDALSKYDWRLYWLATRRFSCEVFFFQNATGISLAHLLSPGGAEWLFDISERVIATWNTSTPLNK